jgi:uncharacterized protein YdhG (YjbR/CyaY superfamily)
VTVAARATSGRPVDTDAYLAGLPDEQRAALQALRETIRAAAPDAEECISYGVPAFRLEGPLVGFGAAARHCSLFLMSGSTVEAHREWLAGYDTSKGTIRFRPDQPLPDALVHTLVHARIAENRAKVRR